MAEQQTLYQTAKRFELVSEQYQQAILWQQIATTNVFTGEVTAVIHRYQLHEYSRELQQLTLTNQ